MKSSIHNTSKTFLITGSHGFIGSNLKKRLEENGHEVITFPREIYQNEVLLTAKILLTKPQYVIHLSAYGNHYHQRDLDQIMYTNVLQTYSLLKVIRDKNVKGFINIGSSSEYGNKEHSMREDDIPETDTFYGASKVASTYLARAFAKQYNIPIVTVRPFSVFGEGEAEDRFIPSVIKALKNNTTYTLSPEPKHDWIYIQDFIDGIEKVLENVQELKGEVVNIGTGKQFSNLQVVNALEKISNQCLILDYMSEMRSYDNNYWVSQNSKLKSIGWKQNHTLEEGLKKTYEYYSK